MYILHNVSNLFYDIHSHRRGSECVLNDYFVIRNERFSMALLNTKVYVQIKHQKQAQLNDQSECIIQDYHLLIFDFKPSATGLKIWSSLMSHSSCVICIRF